MKYENNVKALRVKMGFTQKRFAGKLKITQSAVSHWERGMSNPSIFIAEKISRMAEKKGLTLILEKKE